VSIWRESETTTRPVTVAAGNRGDADHSRWPIDRVLRAFGWDGHGKRRGQWTDIRCPFHDDRNIGNAGFRRGWNSFRCQACDAKGNSVTLVMQQLRCPQNEAVEWLERKVEQGAPTPTPRRRQWGEW